MIEDSLNVVIPQCEYIISHSENKGFSSISDGKRMYVCTQTPVFLIVVIFV